MENISRKNALLSAIIKEYLKTAEPVGSKIIVEKYKLDVSSATVRNEMAELEAAGFIAQPYTSAGRIPTAKGYQYYLDNFLGKKSLALKEQQSLDKVLNQQVDQIRSIAKLLAELSQNAVVATLGENSFYYTGLSNLFRQPEFSNLDLIQNITEVVEHLDEVMGKVNLKVKDGIKIWVGDANPFSADCAALITEYRPQCLLGILGPLRMDYEQNFARLAYLKSFKVK